MNNTLQALYEQMDFVPVEYFRNSEKFELRDLKNFEDWGRIFCQKMTLKRDLPDNVSNKSYCLILEFIKQGERNGYVLISMPVLVDIPDDNDKKGIFLSPDISEAVSLNSEYYLHEKQDGPPIIQLNDKPFSQEDLSKVFNMGVSKPYFEKAKLFLYQSANVTSFKQLTDKIKKQLRYQNINPRFSLAERASDPSKAQLLDLYKGLISDGANAYASTCLPRLLSVYEDSTEKIECGFNDVYDNFLKLSRDSYNPNQPYLLGHMDTQKLSGESSNISDNRELFPLDNTQRHASLAAAYLDRNYKKNSSLGRVLSVNGPPGSGKTSMLKAVVAHYFVKAAILEEPCPIIVASGATNQSVKNVTSAFPDVVQNDNDSVLLHYQRWIPNCGTYGSFYASKDAIEKLTESEKSEIPILKTAGTDKPYNFEWEGLGSGLNDIHNNDNLSNYYLDKANKYFNQLSIPSQHNIAAVVSKLHKILLEVYKQMSEAVYEAKRQLLDGGGDIAKVFPIKYKEDHLKTFVSERDKLIKLYQMNDPSIYEEVCREAIRDKNIKTEDYIAELRETAILLLIERCVDLEYRTQLFHLAARYWEGKYILDQASNLHFARTEKNIIDGLRRVCMITPVIISTVNRLPSLLKIDSYTPGSIQNSYVYGGVDLLITDESGQSTIYAALPLAGLAKRLISVGDVLQLAPVLGQKEVTAHDEFFIWMKNGFTQKQITANIFKNKYAITNGSFLHVVQGASSLNYQGHGFMLRGHYRCYQNIIEYCNQMVYENKLFYLPNLNKDLADKGLPAMAYVESSSSSSIGNDGGSKKNDGEAELIAKMVVNRYTKWQQILGGKPLLQDMVAIITPFRQQPDVIRAALIKENNAQGSPITEEEIQNTVINTIHTLQGAEKDIVIYSGVQSKDDSGTLFFEDQPFLLNVAISRAKKSFIAFLNPDLYKLNNFEFVKQKEPKKDNSIHFLGWYMASHGIRLFPNYLFVVEAPGKKKTLENILKENYLVIATGGAITELSLEDASVETAIKQLRPNYQLKENGIATLQAIITEGPKVEKIYLATDDDNVGETISWHIYHHIKKLAPELIEKIQRVPLRAITEDGVKEAMANSREIDNNKVSAEVVRDIVDKWLAQYMYELLKGTLPSRTGIGRVIASILDIIDHHGTIVRQRNNTTVDIQLTVNKRTIKGSISNVSEDKILKIREKLENDGVAFLESKKEYKLVRPESVEVSIKPPPGRSTFDIMAMAWKIYQIKPEVTMRLLQRLYEGSDEQ
ncbi:AAA domain-containing protein [Moraxella canis]|uniref:AAA domain-containing protein n=1 Tax=Moraxella canis TaxID=90239 RepID=UPI0006668D73|nr:AAA domain-containing protein [Moraxella canis]